MREAISSAAVAALLLLATGCKGGAATAGSATPAIGEADAGKLADATIAAWMSGDAARIKALYAPDIAGFAMATPALASDRATWDKYQDGFAAAKFDRSAEKDPRKIQLLDSDTFVVSGAWDISSSASPAVTTTARCTDVYERQGDGKWLIANEHCSMAPNA